MSDWLSDRLLRLGGEPTFWCPGCKMPHRVNVERPNETTGARWTWNGETKAATFHPSYHIVGRCHCWVRDGFIQFLSDCTHDLAGQTVILPVWPVEDAEVWGP